jgi:hypothetical protein
MANNYFVATGVLNLDRVTPLITALFNDFNLDASYPGDGRAYIALIDESARPRWEDVLLRLSTLGADQGILPREASDAETVLSAWAKYFHAEQDEELRKLIERHAFEDAADLDTLFLLAIHFDDGHRLTGIEFEGAWYCNKPRLFEFGGEACFHSREVLLCGDSHRVLGFGSGLHTALRQCDFIEAAELLTQEILRLLDSIQDRDARDTVLRLVIGRLAELFVGEMTKR